MTQLEHTFNPIEVIKSNGLRIPLNDIFVDTFRTDSYPSARKVTNTMTKILDCIPEKYLEKVRIRGSTPIYGALQKDRRHHKRGTISFSLMSHLDKDLRDCKDLPISKALSQLEYAPNIDIFFEGIGEDEFQEIIKQIEENLKKLALPSFNSKKGDLLLKPHHWHIGTNNPLMEKREVSIRKTRINVVSGRTPGGVANMFIHFNSLGRVKKDSVPLSHLYLAADQTQYVEWQKGKPIFDTRKDERYALSWDLTKGKIKKERKQYFIEYEKEDIKKLYEPIKIGNNFKDLPASQRFLLLLRAAQKGTMAEDLLNLSEEGRLALATRQGHAASIEPESLIILQEGINPDELHKELELMKDEEKEEFQAYVQQYMLTGLFYPHKFNEYCRELNIYRFFPQMNYTEEQSKLLGYHLESIVPQAELEKILYTSTHPYDTWYINQSWRSGQFDVMKAPTFDPQFYELLKSFINPYALFFLALQIARIPINSSYNSPFNRLDDLLSLHRKQISSNSITTLPIQNPSKDYKKIFEIDVTKIDIPFTLSIGLIEIIALIIPALLNTQVIENYVANIHLLSKIFLLFYSISGFEAIRLLTGKQTILKHAKESGIKG